MTRDAAGKLSPWAAPIISALIAAGASVIGSAYVGGQRAGAQDAVIAEHSVRIDRIEGEAKAASKATADASLTVADRLGGLTSQVADLTKGFERLERRLDEDGQTTRHASTP